MARNYVDRDTLENVQKNNFKIAFQRDTFIYSINAMRLGGC